MSEDDSEWMPELDELINNVDALRSDFGDLHELTSEIKELCALFLQNNYVVDNKDINEKIPLHRTRKRKQNREHIHR